MRVWLAGLSGRRRTALKRTRHWRRVSVREERQCKSIRGSVMCHNSHTERKTLLAHERNRAAWHEAGGPKNASRIRNPSISWAVHRRRGAVVASAARQISQRCARSRPFLAVSDNVSSAAALVSMKLSTTIVTLFFTGFYSGRSCGRRFDVGAAHQFEDRHDRTAFPASKVSIAARHGRPELIVPAVAADRIGVRPFVAGILDFICETEHRSDAGNRGRRGRGEGASLPHKRHGRRGRQAQRRLAKTTR